MNITLQVIEQWLQTASGLRIIIPERARVLIRGETAPRVRLRVAQGGDSHAPPITFVTRTLNLLPLLGGREEATPTVSVPSLRGEKIAKDEPDPEGSGSVCIWPALTFYFFFCLSDAISVRDK